MSETHCNQIYKLNERLLELRKLKSLAIKKEKDFYKDHKGFNGIDFEIEQSSVLETINTEIENYKLKIKLQELFSVRDQFGNDSMKYESARLIYSNVSFSIGFKPMLAAIEEEIVSIQKSLGI